MLAVAYTWFILSIIPPTPPEEVGNFPILLQLDPLKIASLTGEKEALGDPCDYLLDALDAPMGSCFEETLSARRERLESESPVDYGRWMILNIPGKAGDFEAAEAFTAALTAHSLVLWAELDYDAAGWRPSSRREPEEEAYTPARIPEDPYFNQQYYHRIIHTPEAWALSTGSESILVAVLDTGCDPDIPDLKGRLLPAKSFIADDTDLEDHDGHGSSIATLIAATGENQSGIAGMDWHCRILPILAAEGGIAVWVQAIDYAVAQGARIINISGRLSLPHASPFLEEALARAHAAGVILVASAGNQNQDFLPFPAASPSVIAVGAVDGADHRWQDPVHRLGGNYGEGLDLVAPGQDIVTLGKDGKRVSGGGTSAAAALVSGACSLMLAINPSLTPDNVRKILCDSADKPGGETLWKEPWNAELGYGRLNVYRAVYEASQYPR